MSGRENICFLVYDSRSGSTLLSRLLVERIAGVEVTPEIGFDCLLSLSGEALQRADKAKLAEKFANRLDFDNVAIDRKRITSIFENASGESLARVLVNAVLKEWLVSRRCDARCIVVKHGAHIRYWRKLHELWQDSLLLFIVRDPRGVVASKVATPRPYFPKESMAWGGVLIAAIRWRHYVRLFHQARHGGAKTALVKYEDLIEDPQNSCEAVSAALDVESDKDESKKRRYFIPASEQAIHSKVFGDVDRSRINSWQDALSSSQVRVVECVCQDEMLELGYRVCGRSWLTRLFWITAYVPLTVILVIKHYSHMIGARLSRD